MITYKELFSNEYFQCIDVIYGGKDIVNKVKHIETYQSIIDKDINNLEDILVIIKASKLKNYSLVEILDKIKKNRLKISGLALYDDYNLKGNLDFRKFEVTIKKIPILYIPNFYKITDIIEKFEELRYYVYIHKNINIESNIEISRNGIINRNLLEIASMLANTLDNKVEIIDVLNKRSYYSNRKVIKHGSEYINNIISPKKYDKKISIINIAKMIRYINKRNSWIVMPISYNNKSVFYLIIWEKSKQIESREYKYIYISYMLIYIMYGERYVDYKYKRKIEDNLIKHLIYDLEISRDEFYFNLKKLDKIINRNWIPIYLIDKYPGNDMNYIKREIIYAVNKVLGEENTLLSLLSNNAFLIILNYDDNGITFESLYNDLTLILEKVRASRVKSDFKIGVGTPTTDINQINDRYRKAIKAIHIGEHIDKYNDIRFYSQLGILRTIDLKELVEYISDQDFEYKKIKNKDYLDMIEVFIKSNGNYEKASKILKLHENTLRYRMNKVEQDLKIDLNNYQDITKLSIIIKFKDYL